MDTGKAPFLVTIALAVIGWAAIHVEDRVVNSPTIEFYPRTEIRYHQSILVIRLTNLTDNVTFSGLLLELFPPKGTTIGPLRVVPVEPAYQGSEPAINDDGKSARVQFAEIQPGGVFYAYASYKGLRRPYIEIELPNGTARITTPSPETWIAQNEVKILMGLAAFGVLFILVYYLVQAMGIGRKTAAATPIDVRIVRR